MNVFLFLFFIHESLSAVEYIKPQELENLIGKGSYIFVNFFCSSCPHSIASLPVWENISDYFAYEKRFKFYKMECDRYYTHCVRFGAEGYPVFSVFLPYEKKLKKYNRDKDVQKFVFWVKQNLGIEKKNDL